MPHPFGTPMPDHPVHQKHADPKHSDAAAFLANLDNDEAADVNLNWFWNNLHDKTKSGGGAALGVHYRAPGPCGYARITMGATGHLFTRKFKPHELDKEEWTVAQVKRWRRGKTRVGPRPMTWAQICRYCRRHGGQPVGELKTPAFGIYGWIMQQLVTTCARYNVAAWFKALENMSHADGKSEFTQLAEVNNHHGQFALIFGDHVKGRGARVAAGKKATATWAVKPTAIW